MRCVMSEPHFRLTPPPLLLPFVLVASFFVFFVRSFFFLRCVFSWCWVASSPEQIEAAQIMRIRDNIVRMYAMMTGQTQEQITIVSVARFRPRATNRRARLGFGKNVIGPICTTRERPLALTKCVGWWHSCRLTDGQPTLILIYYVKRGVDGDTNSFDGGSRQGFARTYTRILTSKVIVVERKSPLTDSRRRFSHANTSILGQLGA